MPAQQVEPAQQPHIDRATHAALLAPDNADRESAALQSSNRQLYTADDE
jgi:hypothetical protein